LRQYGGTNVCVVNVGTSVCALNLVPKFGPLIVEAMFVPLIVVGPTNVCATNGAEMI